MGQAHQQSNEDVVRTCLTKASRGNYDVFETILTPSYVVHPEEARGAAGLQERWSMGTAPLSATCASKSSSSSPPAIA